jgi:hypothetical protein
MRWVRLAVLAAVVALSLAGAQSGLGRETQQQPCTWGASSAAGKLVDGEFVFTQPPTTTGCVPR